MERILVAFDFPSLDLAVPLAKKLRGLKVGRKVGLQLTTAEGVPAVVRALGEDVFLDVKFKDIPNTVTGAVEAAASLGVKMLNVHCMGGSHMMRAAAEAVRKVAEKTRKRRTLVIGVTVLTSLERDQLTAIGIDPRLSVEYVVTRLAILAQKAGLDGVVCSPREISAVREACGENFIIVTPGIRSKDDKADDQRRTLTAGEAIGLGANYLVIGRPITQAEDPEARAEEFAAEIDARLQRPF